MDMVCRNYRSGGVKRFKGPLYGGAFQDENHIILIINLLCYYLKVRFSYSCRACHNPNLSAYIYINLYISVKMSLSEKIVSQTMIVIGESKQMHTYLFLFSGVYCRFCSPKRQS